MGGCLKGCSLHWSCVNPIEERRDHYLYIIMVINGNNNNNNDNDDNNNNIIIYFICQKFKLYNNYLQDKKLKERLNIYMIITFDYFSRFYNKW